MKRKTLFFTIIAIIVIAILITISSLFSSSSDYSTFAECLTTNGAVMYGTSWCGYCQNQKNLFGDGFEKIKFIDCDSERETCILDGIQGYPTWIINKVKYPGIQSLERLSEITGCPLIQDP